MQIWDTAGRRRAQYTLLLPPFLSRVCLAPSTSTLPCRTTASSLSPSSQLTKLTNRFVYCSGIRTGEVPKHGTNVLQGCCGSCARRRRDKSRQLRKGPVLGRRYHEAPSSLLVSAIHQVPFSCFFWSVEAPDCPSSTLPRGPIRTFPCAPSSPLSRPRDRYFCKRCWGGERIPSFCLRSECELSLRRVLVIAELKRNASEDIAMVICCNKCDLVHERVVKHEEVTP